MPPISPSLSPRVVDVLADRYEFEREVGRGGMAVVWLARDLKHDRLVALKIFDPEIGATVGVERFQREIRVTARLQHPYILPVFDSGEAGGFLWYAMPYVEGETLHGRLARERQLPIPETLRLIQEAADTLDYAHTAGVIHRDIKPENIYLSRGHALVADFGIARAIIRTPGDDAITATGIVVGTAGYMSPEQAAGERSIDGRTDIYSLGCVLYEMLAGERPFAGANVQATLAQVLTAPVPSISARRTDVPPGLEQVLMKAMAKAPDDRYPTAGAFAAALVAVGTYAGVDALREVVPLVDRPSVAVLPFHNVSRNPEDEYLSDGITEDIITRLGKIGALRVISRTSAMRFKGSTSTMRDIAAALGVSVVLEGSVRRAADQLRVTAQLIDARSDEQIWAETYDRRLSDVFEVQSQVAESIAVALATKLTAAERAQLRRRQTTDLETYNLYLLGRHHFAKYNPGAWRRSIEYFERAIGRDPTFALAHADIAVARTLLAYLGTAQPKDVFPSARAAAVKALELDDSLGDAHAALGLVLAAYDWKWHDAESEFRRALQLDPNSVHAHMWYAVFVLAPLGRHGEAMAMMRQAQLLDPVSLPVSYNVGYCLFYARRYDEAIAAFQQALELDRDFVPARSGLGFCYVALARFDDAIREIRRAVADGAVTSDAVLGYVYALAGHREHAREVLRTLQQRATHEYVIPLDFALIHAALGDRDEAFRWLSQGFEERSTLLIWINVAIWYDSIRSDPRFTNLVERLGLRADATSVVTADVTAHPEKDAAQRAGSATRKRNLFTAAALAAALVASIAGWLGIRQTRASPLPSNRLAVMPFAVTGPARVEGIGSGMVELLGAALDGAGDLTTVDERAVLATLRRESADSTDPGSARDVARLVGAGKFILGNVAFLGTRAIVNAALYGADGHELILQVHESGTPDSLTELVDRIARRIVARASPGAEADLTELAGITTQSNDALKAYLRGRLRFREGRHQMALGDFEKAVAIDSNFALGWYALGRTASFTAERDLERAALIRANGLRGHLPALDQLRIESALLFASGHIQESEQAFREIIRRRPDDLDAQMGLAELLVHGAHRMGRSVLEAEPLLERVAYYEPNSSYVLNFERGVAADLRNLARYDSLSRRYVELSPNADFVLPYKAEQAYLGKDTVAERVVLNELADADDFLVGFAATAVGGWVQNLKGAVLISEELLNPRRSPEIQLAARVMLAHLEIAQGDWTSASKELDQAAVLDSATALQARALLSLHPLFQMSSDSLKQLYARLEASKPPSLRGGSWLDRSRVQRGFEPEFRLYLLGSMAARVGNEAAALAAARELDKRGPGEVGREYAKAAAASVRAQVEMSQGHFERAVALFDSQQVHVWWSMYFLQPFFSQGFERYLRAECLTRLGRTEEAARWYRSNTGAISIGETIYLVPSLIGLRGAAVKLGHRAEVSAIDARLREIWRDPHSGKLDSGVIGARTR